MVKPFFLFIIFFFIGLNIFAFPLVSGDVSRSDINFSEGNLAENIYKKLPLCDEILVIGSDGTAVLIPSYAFEMANLVQNNKIWNLNSKKLPPVCNIRNIKEICIKQTPARYSITIKNGDTIKRYSPFMFILSRFKFLGESEKNGYTLRKYKLSDKKQDIKNIDKIIFTSGKTIQTGKIIFKNYYFSCLGDTIKKIILKDGDDE